MRLVQDTNVFVAALRSGAGASRELLRRLLQRVHRPLMGDKLWYEYQDVTGRAEDWTESPLTPEQRQQAVADFAAVCDYVAVPRMWRPNLPDEGDNHVMELVLHGNAGAIVTFNTRDFERAMFAPAGLAIVKPGAFLKRFSTP